MLRIAIVGRPNVGKSALLNRMARRTVSIVHDQPGVTRDRVHATVDREGEKFEFVDTGGIGLFETETTPKVIADAVQMQVEIAIQSSDLILMVADGLEGPRPLDQEIARRLRKSGKPFWLLVNKLDLGSHEAKAVEFSQMGVDPIHYVSASHGRGIPELWEALVERARLQPKGAEGEEKPGDSRNMPSIAVIGRPNVGKSSLVNRLLGLERVIVSEVPGTTRDSVELEVAFNKKYYRLIDTAGIRHKTKIRTNVEMYSWHWTEKSIARCDIALLMLSALEGATRQDREIAGLIQEYQKPCIIMVNKWDLNETVEYRPYSESGKRQATRVKRRLTSRSEYEAELRYQMPFLDYAPVMFISALEGYHALNVWKTIGRVTEARNTTFTTGVLNRVFSRAQERVQAPMQQGRRLKIYYVTQKISAPVPTFMVFINQKKLWVESYGRYLINQLREENPMMGCPIIFELREHTMRHEPTERKIISRSRGRR
jgi:GTPase